MLCRPTYDPDGDEYDEPNEPEPGHYNIAPPFQNGAKHRDLRCVFHLSTLHVLGAKHVSNPGPKEIDPHLFMIVIVMQMFGNMPTAADAAMEGQPVPYVRTSDLDTVPY